MLEFLDNEIWKLFVKHPTDKLHIREAARQAGRSPTYSMQKARELIDAGLLRSEWSGRNLVLSSDWSDKFLLEKKWTNIFVLLQCGIIEKLKDAGVKKAVLFGSFSRGEDTSKSDIDIAIEPMVRIDLSSIERGLERGMQLHHLKTDNELLRDNISEGVRLI